MTCSTRRKAAVATTRSSDAAMSTRIASAVVAPVWMVGALLTIQTAAGAQTAPDSLGLRVFNAIAHAIPGEISIDATFRAFLAQAPALRATTLGVMHAVWETPPRADRLRTMFVFRADSGDLLGRAFSSKSRLTVIDARASDDDVEAILRVLPALRAVADTLGPPAFCERDTTVSDEAGAIFTGAVASWRRGTVRILFDIHMNLRAVLPINSGFARRFSFSYLVFRSTDPLMRWDEPTGHDSPCFITDDELREHAAPLDSAAYDSVRATLMKRPTKPARR